jgi:SAM-dependent methyltransferase
VRATAFVGSIWSLPRRATTSMIEPGCGAASPAPATASRRASGRLSAMELTAWVRSQLPPPPARLLEVGCGDGRLARRLAAAGHDVLAIDPVAPRGAIFERTTIETLEDRGSFDAVVASRSLHHVHDLDGALAKVARLAPLLVLDEFTWDRLDEATARWYEEHRRRADVPPVAEWHARHGHLHGDRALRAALARHFEELAFARVPYLYRYFHLPELEPLESQSIASGKIQALGFRFVGSPRRD